MSSPPENVESWRSRSASSSKPRPRTMFVARSRHVQPPACSRRASAREYCANAASSPSAIFCARRVRSASSATSSAQPLSTYSRSVSDRSRGGRWSCSETLQPFWKESSPPSIEVSPASIRSSVVLPAPLRPAIVRRSLRSSLNDTPRSSGLPTMSLLRSEAMRTAMAAMVGAGAALQATACGWRPFPLLRGHAACPQSAIPIVATVSAASMYRSCAAPCVLRATRGVRATRTAPGYAASPRSASILAEEISCRGSTPANRWRVVRKMSIAASRYPCRSTISPRSMPTVASARAVRSR